ncbi:MAG TPA: hypothetical protein VHL11_24615, partial [Phototrophicaceae bacterium]|nr:hypothetical protein [Phototrophicaceae bacterium]
MMSVLFSTGISVATVEAASSTACAVTPGVLGGQGFTVSGLGFTVSGLGFTVSGLGFTVSGLGFTVSGLGIDPKQVAAEIMNNPISSQWLTDLLPGVQGGHQYDSTKTAILIVDDQAHGNQVESVFNALLPAVGSSNIQTFRIDVSDSSTNYNADLITSRLQSKINELKANGFKHFVINMSFGLVPCDDAGPVLGGVQYPWSFQNMVNWVNNENQNHPAKPIVPTLDCVISNGNGTSTALFGYRNDNWQPSYVAVGVNNKFTPSAVDRGQPYLFETGRRFGVIKVIFSEPKITWGLKGPDGVSRFAAAYQATGSVKTSCASFPTPNLTVRPVVNCVADNGNGTYTASFGYTSGNEVTVVVPVGANNSFSPAPADRLQATHFMKGTHDNVFKVTFDGTPVTWT